MTVDKVYTHQQQRNVRPIRLEVSGAPGAPGAVFCKIALYDGAYVSRRNDPSHTVTGTTLLPTVQPTHYVGFLSFLTHIFLAMPTQFQTS